MNSDKIKQEFLRIKALGFLENVRIRDKPFILKGEEILNHKARTNVHDKFWGRKYKVNQFDVCDYLKIDSEGAEFDIILNTKKEVFEKISFTIYKIIIYYHMYNVLISVIFFK